MLIAAILILCKMSYHFAQVKKISKWEVASVTIALSISPLAPKYILYTIYFYHLKQLELLQEIEYTVFHFINNKLTR